jgi:hypothetical protein
MTEKQKPNYNDNHSWKLILDKILYHTPRQWNSNASNGLYAFVSNFTAGRVE